MYQHILMPTDGSACAHTAIREGLRLARVLGARVTFVHVLENPLSVAYAAPEAVAYSAQLQEDLRAGADRVLREAKALAEEAGVEAETRLLERHDPASAIREASEDFDLVVMGTHGRRGFDRWMFGSVAEGALRGSSKPFLLLRGDDGAPVADDAHPG